MRFDRKLVPYSLHTEHGEMYCRRIKYRYKKGEGEKKGKGSVRIENNEKDVRYNTNLLERGKGTAGTWEIRSINAVLSD